MVPPQRFDSKLHTAWVIILYDVFFWNLFSIRKICDSQPQIGQLPRWNVAVIYTVTVCVFYEKKQTRWLPSQGMLRISPDTVLS